MNLHSLKPAKGSVKKVKRIGRGQGSGHGGTSTRGNKGAGQRSGTKTKRGHEGGQMPLQRRIPKFGFKNINRIEYAVINLGKLQEFADKYNTTNFDHASIIKMRLAGKNDRIKILATGELKAKVSVAAHAASETAKKAIEAAGGTLTII